MRPALPGRFPGGLPPRGLKQLKLNHQAGKWVPPELLPLPSHKGRVPGWGG